MRLGVPDPELGCDEELVPRGDEPRAERFGYGLPHRLLRPVDRGGVEVAVAKLDGAKHGGSRGLGGRQGEGGGAQADAEHGRGTGAQGYLWDCHRPRDLEGKREVGSLISK